MDADTKVFLKKKFKAYYWVNQVMAPDTVHRREFGVGTLDDKIKFRHKSFTSEKAFNQYLRTEAPYYISYSAAYYEFPEQSMECKGWLGADLIFDLDKPMHYLDQQRIDEVTDEALKLTEFLYDDFGFDKKDVRTNFSGSKGYHIHVISDEVKSLDADARREIIDYISGTGLDISFFLKPIESAKGVKYVRGKNIIVGEKYVGPTADSTGWAKRIYDVSYEVLNLPKKQLMEIKGVGEKTAIELDMKRPEYIKSLKSGNWMAFWDNIGSKVRAEIRKRAISVKDEDRQVTADISRLIRVPDTIHGGSGLLAKKTKTLESFNPLVDAVAFTKEQMKIKLTEKIPEFDIMQSKWGPYKKDEIISVEDYVGTYLLLKGKAEILT